MKFLLINDDNVSSLKDFILKMGKSMETFRYYDKRTPEQAIANHLITLLLFDEELIGYGHLDKEGNKVWLGICVIEGKTGKGYGNKIMKRLVDSYNGEISLSVDKENMNAISLYKKHSFREVKKENSLVYMKRNDTRL